MIYNLTGHDININGKIIKPEGLDKIVRLAPLDFLYSFEIDDDIEVAIYRKPESMRLPPYKAGVYYIVSRVVAEYNRDRPDLLFPDTTKYSAVRLPSGELYMTTRLSSVYDGYIDGTFIHE